MAHVARFRSGQPPEYLRSVHTPEYVGDPDVLINPDISAVESLPLKYWKRVGAAIQAMTAPEQAAVDAAEATAVTTQQRTSADQDAERIAWRAFAGILLDELNDLRGWITAYKVEVAAATNLANLQTRVAALPNLPTRTVAQARTAYANRISSGGAD